ncbi:MAG: acyl-ACP--UDP-N-acetylglucosamine O-acyltransferase [Desulfuromonadales bacterium]
MPNIHPTAIVDPSARLAENVEIGPHAFIDADVSIGSGSRIMHGAHIGRWTTMGSENRVYPGAVIGLDPQDVGYGGERSDTVIGDGNIFREGVTVHRGNQPETKTIIGNNNFFMVNSHVAHNCIVANNVILVNGVLLAGHVEIADRVLISGNCQVHQFVRIGSHAMMRGGSRLTKDLPPFCVNDGINWVRTINAIGLKRSGFGAERLRVVKKAFKILFRSGLATRTAVEKLEKELPLTEDTRYLLEFIRTSKRGIAGGPNQKD